MKMRFYSVQFRTWKACLYVVFRKGETDAIDSTVTTLKFVLLGFIF